MRPRLRLAAGRSTEQLQPRELLEPGFEVAAGGKDGGDSGVATE